MTRAGIAVTVFVVFGCWWSPARSASNEDPFAPTDAGAAPRDPFAPDPAVPSAPPAAGTPAPPPLAAPPAAPPTGCDDVGLTDERCRDANTGLLVKAGGYVLLCVLLFTILRMWWNRRGTMSAAARFLLPLLLCGALAGVLVGLDPLRGRIANCCVRHGDFMARMVLQDSDIARAVLLGALPAIGLYVLVTVVERLVKR